MIDTRSQTSIIKSATTAMAAAIVMVPTVAPAIASTETGYSLDAKPLVRAAIETAHKIVERTDGTILYPVELWQPRLSLVDFERATIAGKTMLPSFAGDVRSVLDLSGWTATEFGDIIGVTRVRVQQWLTGGNPSPASKATIVQIKDILERAHVSAGCNDMERWLITPSAEDGKTPTQLLAARDFDSARMRASLTPSSVVRIPGLEDTAKSSPWAHLLEG